MTALTADIRRTYESGDINQLPVKGGAIIYEGAAVGINSSGYAKPLQNGDKFVGFAEDNSNNFSGGDGVKNIRLRKRGAILIEISGITLADIKKSVYASDDNTFTLSEEGTVYIGKISRIDSGGIAIVEFDAASFS